jgi:hypothetical protein
MDLERRCVLPFYLRMMGLNALSHVVPFDTLRDVARETTDDEVTRLLASEWRPRVMGAWLASIVTFRRSRSTRSRRSGANLAARQRRSASCGSG